jgi:hypothetical protein
MRPKIRYACFKCFVSGRAIAVLIGACLVLSPAAAVHQDVPTAFAAHHGPVATAIAPSHDYGDQPHNPLEPNSAVPSVIGYSVTAAPPDADGSVRIV